MFAANASEAGQCRHVRGVALAVAQDWLIRIPETPKRDMAIAGLLDAADLACEALAPTG